VEPCCIRRRRAASSGMARELHGLTAFDAHANMTGTRAASSCELCPGPQPRGLATPTAAARSVAGGGAHPPRRLPRPRGGRHRSLPRRTARTSRAGEQRSRRAFAAPSDAGPSGGRQHAEGEASGPRTAGRRRCPARQRPEGWTENEIPSTLGSLPTVGSRSYDRY